MFTWNYQYISKARLEKTFEQMMLAQDGGDVLVRIHTAIHLEDEAVELARFIKSIVPSAKIIGTSTSAVINRGKLAMNQCVISVTQMHSATVRTMILPTVDEKSGLPLSVDSVCSCAKQTVMQKDMKLLFAFLAGEFFDIDRMIAHVNECAPGVKMTGGIVNLSAFGQQKECEGGFVFDETGWSGRGLLLASVAGKEADCAASYATGAQAIGDSYEITDAFENCILKLGKVDAAKEYRTGVGEALRRNPEKAELFPLVYADHEDIPVPIRYESSVSLSELFPPEDPVYRASYEARPDLDITERKDRILTNHGVTMGRELRRAFIYDRKIIADNHAMFRHIENFEKAETLIGYSGAARSLIYSNCAKWELSAYENSNICGCVTAGEIVNDGKRNLLAYGAFAVVAAGEQAATQECNPYAFSHTDSLAADNQELVNYLTEIESRIERRPSAALAAAGLREFVRDCELKLLYSENEDIPNEAAMNMDMKLRGYDRFCIITVQDTAGMKVVFDESRISLTAHRFLSKCADFAARHNYRIYSLDTWQVALGVTSYTCSFQTMVRHMEQLQKELFAVSEGLIAIVPDFCVINGCTVENLKSVYNSASLEMKKKNVQFYVCDAEYYQSDEDSIRERYSMINLINYAIQNDGIIPYYQGIYDNKTGTIHHYESLMRLKDENGNVYGPFRFLEVARSYGLLYDSASAIMIKKVCERFRHSEDISVSINLGIRDINNHETMDYLYDFLSEVKHPENFIFEILENEDIDAYEVLENFVDRIHELGAKISIDDFGSGYSNLQHVANIHSDYLKIDGSIVRKCCESREAEILMTLIMSWAKINTGIRVVAEFVENEEIQNKVLKYGIDFSQGYLFSKPTPDIAV